MKFCLLLFLGSEVDGVDIVAIGPSFRAIYIPLIPQQGIGAGRQHGATIRPHIVKKDVFAVL